MAYGERYYAGWSSRRVNSLHHGYVLINERDYVGSSEELILVDRSLRMSYRFQDWNEPIIGLVAEFSINNNRTGLGFFDLLPLMTAQEKQYQVQIYDYANDASSGELIFEGYLNSEPVTTKYLHYQNINLVASSFLSKLENVHPTIIDTLQYSTFIDIIDQILRSTGSVYNIRVNCKLWAKLFTLAPGQSLFNKHGCYTELFWEDNLQRKTSLETLRSILRTFDCYIYWWKGYWYIERYEDIWGKDCYVLQTHAGVDLQTHSGETILVYGMQGDASEVSITYVEYQSGTTYAPDQSAGTYSISRPAYDLHSLSFIDKSQTIKIVPGLKKITVSLEDKSLLNCVLNDFSGTNSSLDYSGTASYNPNPDVRKWKFWDFGESGANPSRGWFYRGQSYMNIVNSAYRSVGDQYDVNTRGFYTKIKVTVDTTTTLEVKFKYAVKNISTLNALWAESDWENNQIKFQFGLRQLTTGNNGYDIYQDSAGKWVKGVSQGAVWVETLAYDKMNRTTGVVEVTTTIPLGEIYSTKPGDYTFVIGILGEIQVITSPNTSLERNQQMNTYTYWGDVFATVTGGVQNNVVEGTLPNNFINSKEISLDLYDMSSYNYRNGILGGTGSVLDTRTESWSTNGVQYYPITERILKNKFQLYNKSTQVITAQLIDETGFHPLRKYVDSKQSNKTFILTSYVYELTEDKYDCEFWEYDNMSSIGITLI